MYLPLALISPFRPRDDRAKTKILASVRNPGVLQFPSRSNSLRALSLKKMSREIKQKATQTQVPSQNCVWNVPGVPDVWNEGAS